MSLYQQVKSLLYKEVLLEWRNKHAINSILLYVVSTVFVCFQAFKSVDAVIWNVLFWIILLFTAINAMSRSFSQESQNRQLYYYTIVSPKAVILSKIIYNTGVMLLISTIAFAVYSVIFKNPIGDFLFYLIAVLLGSISFANVFTMISGISAKTSNNSSIMAILSFPVIIPLLIVLIEFSKNAMIGMEKSNYLPEIGVLIAINIVTIAISLLLFPYLWRD